MRKHLVLPDCQIKPEVPLEHLSWLGEYICKIKPDVIVCLGDFADMPSLSSYEAKGSKSYEGKRYKEDIKAVRLGMKMLLQPLREYQKWTIESHKPRYEPRLVLTLGNHEDRITRAIEADPQHLEGLISLEDLQYREAGWEVIPYLQPIEIDGLMYAHYFMNVSPAGGSMGHPITNARALLTKLHMSCFAGHQQGRDIAYGKCADGRVITAIIAGSYYQHDEDYMGIQGNRHWRGIFVLHEIERGGFDEMPVSLNYLKRKYGDGK